MKNMMMGRPSTAVKSTGRRRGEVAIISHQSRFVTWRLAIELPCGIDIRRGCIQIEKVWQAWQGRG